MTFSARNLDPVVGDPVASSCAAAHAFLLASCKAKGSCRIWLLFAMVDDIFLFVLIPVCLLQPCFPTHCVVASWVFGPSLHDRTVSSKQRFKSIMKLSSVWILKDGHHVSSQVIMVYQVLRYHGISWYIMVYLDKFRHIICIYIYTCIMKPSSICLYIHIYIYIYITKAS